jgi:hypothetical protein
VQKAPLLRQLTPVNAPFPAGLDGRQIPRDKELTAAVLSLRTAVGKEPVSSPIPFEILPILYRKNWLCQPKIADLGISFFAVVEKRLLRCYNKSSFNGNRERFL